MNDFFDPHKYFIAIQRVIIDGKAYFEATIKELPDVVEYGETYDEAYELAIDTIETTQEVFAENNREFPPPYKRIDEYSAQVTLRMPTVNFYKKWDFPEML
ncbi:MAG: hypothetical protein GY862_13665 [Gammaproteobacteria bacterium]|nr:hypothetical protein [Gammaproteobacteria bacterium]